MKKILNSAVIAFATLGVVGCVSTPDPVAPIAFDTNYSYAYNVANQTALTRNDSPLRDITSSEIETITRNVRDHSGGDTAIFFGTMSILTGNLTGVIDVAGGVASNIAKSGHAASLERYIIILDESKFKDSVAAEKYIIDVTRTALEDTMRQYGDVSTKKLDGLLKGHVTYILNVEGDQYVVGGLHTKPKGDAVKKTTVDFGKGATSVWSYGVEDVRTELIGSIFVQPPTPLIYAVENQAINYTDFYKDFTSRLPEGFYIYTPSFPSIVYEKNGERYKASYPSEIVPALYHRGEKHEFVKPE